MLFEFPAYQYQRHISGLDEPLFQRLTTSPAEPYLKGLKELFINFWGNYTLPLHGTD